MEFESYSIEETRLFGSQCARAVQAGDVYALVGDLGVGKTEFVRGFVETLAPGAAVRSPSFTLLNVYDTPRFPIYHFDFYRLGDPSELAEIGFEEYLNGQGVCLVEWADMFKGVLPDSGVTNVFIFDTGTESRLIRLERFF